MLSYGICLSPFIPIRSRMIDSAEMDSQLLFGDLITIKQQRYNWYEIYQEMDGCEGWVDKKEISIINEQEYNNLKNGLNAILNKSMISIIDEKDNTYFIGMGSTLFNINFDRGFSFFAGKKYQIKQKDLEGFINTKSISPVNIAKRLINTSYLWGGKSAFGIDCSGLTQTVYRIFGKVLPRNASQQAEIGQTINFLSEAQNGDLAFFDNAEGNITHVGILTNQQTIIHSSGKVRIDKIDHHGIFNENIKDYTHRLRVIKRII